MSEHVEALEVAEKYLTEMLIADQAADYQAFIKHFDKAEIDEFNESDFLKDVKSMKVELGTYKSRSFLGPLNDFKREDCSRCIRFVWRAIYEKNEALIIVGIHQVNGTWYINESRVS